MRSSTVFSILAASAAVNALPQAVAAPQVANGLAPAQLAAFSSCSTASGAGATGVAAAAAVPAAVTGAGAPSSAAASAPAGTPAGTPTSATLSNIVPAAANVAATGVANNAVAGQNLALASQSAVASAAAASGIALTQSFQPSITLANAAGASATPTGTTATCGSQAFNPAFMQCFPNSGFKLCPIVQGRPMIPCGAGCHDSLSQVCNNGQIVNWGPLPLSNGFGA